MVGILGDEIEGREELGKAKGSLTDIKIEEAKRNQEKITQDTKELVRYMQDVFRRMENDPLGDFQIYMEYKNMTESLSCLADGRMKETSDMMGKAREKGDTAEKTRAIEDALAMQSSIIKELESMSLLSEDVFRHQKMKDVLTAARDLVEYNADFSRSLEELKGKADREKLAELQKNLKQISDLFNSLAKSLTSLPSELPDEFVNSSSVKNIDMGKMADIMKEIEKSISSGNVDEALKKTMDLMKMLSETMDMLQEAASKVPSAGEPSFSRAADEYAKELENIIRNEESLAEETSAFDKKRNHSVFKLQEELARELAKKQKEVIERMKNTARFMNRNFSSEMSYPVIDMKAAETLDRMEKAYEELSDPPLKDAPKYLEDAINGLEVMGRYVENFVSERESGKDTVREKNTALVRKDMEGMIKTEKEILSSLKKREFPHDRIFSKEEQSSISRLSSDQDKLKLRTERLKQKLQILSRSTALIGLDILENMGKGSGAMGEASKSLAERETGKALGKEQEALYHLSQGRDRLKSASQQLAKMNVRAGMPMASFSQPRGGSLPGGRMGFREGHVRIPSPKDYQAPKEFRQDVLEALKEKYPEMYRELIKKYYRRLTE